MPTTLHPPTTRDREQAPAPLTFDQRLALAVLSIDARTETEPFNLADVVTAPVVTTPPVAALLQRAHRRVLRDGGWSRDAARTGSGGLCLAEAIRAEARSHADEGEARLLLRQVLGGGDPIPEMNRRLNSASHAAQVLSQAAITAATRGI